MKSNSVAMLLSAIKRHALLLSGSKGDLKNLSRSFQCKMNGELKSRYDIYRLILKRIAQVIHFCGKQGIALRGHIEDTESPSNNPGNFLALIKMFAAENTVLNDHISKPVLKIATYIYHCSQNENGRSHW